MGTLIINVVLIIVFLLIAIGVYKAKKSPEVAQKEREEMKRLENRTETGNFVSSVPIFAFAGLVGIGGLLGYLLRPSAPLIGQLSFGTVITRGNNLTGIDQLLVSVAETSFNYMIVGMILGGISGVIVAYTLSKRQPSSVIGGQSMAQYALSVEAPKNVELGQSLEQVIDVLGQPEKIVNLGSKIMYLYKDMKVIFIDGKVSDVQ